MVQSFEVIVAQIKNVERNALVVNQHYGFPSKRLLGKLIKLKGIVTSHQCLFFIAQRSQRGALIRERRDHGGNLALSETCSGGSAAAGELP